MSCVCVCICVCVCLCLCEQCIFDNGILAHPRGVSDPNHFCLCLFCICLYLHRSFDNTVLAYEQNVWGPDGLCVHCASLAARPKHQFANRTHYIFRKNIHSESRQSNADMNEIKHKIFEEIHNIHINFVVIITINCIICFSCLLLFQLRQEL